MIEHLDIAALIPHAGTMCLLDQVVAWNAHSISCTSRSHLAEANPLREAGRLGAACGVEYAAQAMALHGGLAGRAPGRGYLVSLRALCLDVDRLDDIAGELSIMVEKLGDTESQVSYQFQISGGGKNLLRGRAMIVLEGAAK
jgi:predicted hotdog family 3-hydroxylacyl-ACP dehydratase